MANINKKVIMLLFIRFLKENGDWARFVKAYKYGRWDDYQIYPTLVDLHKRSSIRIGVSPLLCFARVTRQGMYTEQELWGLENKWNDFQDKLNYYG